MNMPLMITKRRGVIVADLLWCLLEPDIVLSEEKGSTQLLCQLDPKSRILVKDPGCCDVYIA
jgi:hypothetical protein